MTKILCFAGQIGSGKSTVSKLVADKFGWRRTGFGDFLRAEGISRGLDSSDRVVLQNLGQEFIGKGWRPFCFKVLEAAGWIPGENLIVDGIRHVQAIDTLQEIIQCSDVKLVYITAAESLRTQRVVTRGRENNLVAESHPVESEVSVLLPTRADVVVDNSLSEAQAIQKITDELRLWVYGR